MINIKKILLILSFILFLFGCKDSATENDIERPEPAKIDTGNVALQEETKAIWKYEFDSTLNDYKPVQQRSVSSPLTPQMIEQIVNKTWPQVQVKYIRTSHDTVYVSIPDSHVLTQQMGSTGALEFMVSTTFTFTELKGIQFVSFDFEEGDHAAPGVYDRTSWTSSESALQ